MNRPKRQCAFSAVEVITTVAILAILAGMLLGLGKRVRVQAEEKLAQSTINIIVAALEQYYGPPPDFPPDPCVLEGIEGLRDFVEQDRGAVFGDSIVTGSHEDEYSSSEALFYFLYKTPDCKRIIDTITDIQITNKGSDNEPLWIEAPVGSGLIDLIRFIDPWGEAFRYTYAPGDTFPLIESGGADKNLATTGDNITSR